MTNSIKDNLDRNTTVSEIILMLGAGIENVCLVVEGADDIKLFAPLLANNVTLFESFCGKNGVDEVVSDFFSDEKRVIGIRDRDYQELPSSEKVLFCDYCCAEMMITSIRSCFCRFISNYDVKNSPENILQDILKKLEFLSKMRLLNEVNMLRLGFDRIRPGKLYNEDTHVMDRNVMCEIAHINNMSELPAQWINQVNNLPIGNATEDLLMITNGHDFINLICNLYNRKGRIETGIAGMEDALRSSFGMYEFSQTELYHNLIEYQERTRIVIIKH